MADLADAAANCQEVCQLNLGDLTSVGLQRERFQSKAKTAILAKPKELTMQSTRVNIHKRIVAAATILFALVFNALFATPAQAATTSASACLQGFAGPTDVVNSYGGITLKCGDLTKGVIHIDLSHPISESGADDVNIKECMNNIIAFGSSTTAGTGNAAKRWRTPSGVYAYIVWRTTQKDVVTMYTSNSSSTNTNRWDLCD